MASVEGLQQHLGIFAILQKYYTRIRGAVSVEGSLAASMKTTQCLGVCEKLRTM